MFSLSRLGFFKSFLRTGIRLYLKKLCLAILGVRVLRDAGVAARRARCALLSPCSQPGWCPHVCPLCDVDTARDAPWQFATSSKPRTKDGNQRRGGHKVKAKCCVTLWSLLRISIFRPDVGCRSLQAVEHGIRTENQHGVCVYVCVYVCVCVFVCVCV